MKPFLQQLADELFDVYGTDISRLCIVFPNRRAGLYFRRYLSTHLTQPVWSPHVLAIEDFVALKSGLTIAGQPELIINLYKLYHQQLNEKARPLRDFIAWGNRLIADFDEIDQYLVDGIAVFNYLTEAKAIEHWNPDGKPLTDFEKSYLQFYNSIAPLYAQFRAELLNSNQAYLGLAFRRLIENIENTSFDEWNGIVFAGFNALTPVEEKLIDYLMKAGKTRIYWDGDKYYVDDKNSEAGLFLRKYRDSKQFGPMNWISDYYESDDREINIAGIPKNIGQVKFAGHLLRKLQHVNKDNIAIVLVDEGLLIPLLNSIPGEIDDFNVTMGFPLKLTPAYSLIDSVFQLVSHAEKSTGKNDNTPFNRYYRDDILRVLKHPYLLSASGSDSFSLKNVEKVLDHSFYTGIELLEAIGTLSKPLAELFDPGFSKSFVSPSDLLALHQKIVQYLSNSFTGTERKLKPEAIDKEYLFSVSLVLQNVRELISGLPEEIDMETLGVLFATLAGAARLPFYGEPLTGLQVMGVLETRTLDFETLIIVSVNEGLLPKGKLQNSFIPADIRQTFALPGYREHNAVFAYHFYRLLQRAKTTWLLYNTESDELGNGEKSRFITQMLYELPRYNPGIKINERVISMPSPAVANDTISISKDSTVAQRLIELAQSGFSPSMLSTYLNCGLQFYFSSILGLSEPDTIDETIDASILGTSVHSALQKLYQPFVGKTVDSQIVRTLIASSAEVVKQEFRSLFSHSDLETGKNMIIVHMAQNMVRRLLETEAEILETKTGNQPIRIQHLEKRLESDIQLNIQGNDVPLRVKIKGIADRIDTYDGQVRIIDYKTGSLDKRELELPSIQALPEMKKPQKVLQLLTYAWMYDRSYSEPVKLTSGIIALKMPRRYLQKVLISRSEILDKGMLSDFESYLTGLLFDIFAPELTFQQTNNQAICVYCSFKSICNR